MADGLGQDRVGLDLADHPELKAAAQFARMVPAVAWFEAVGAPLRGDVLATAEAYLLALGFPDTSTALVADWEEAEGAVRNPEWNTAWWEAEEQLRVALTTEAIERVGDEQAVLVALTQVTARASDAVHEAAEIAAARGGGGADEALIRAAAGAATQGCYHAALVLIAGAEADHPFALKYRLYEAGRWPLGIAGATFNLF